MKETLIPIAGEIYKVKLSSGRTWLFKSAYCGEYKTEHQGAYCIDCDGSDYFRDFVSIGRGYHIGNNYEIIEVKTCKLE